MAGQPFLDALDREFLGQAAGATECGLPFSGGWLLFVGYEIAQEIEPTLVLPSSPDAVAAMAVRIPAAVIYEHESASVQLVAESGHERLLDEMNSDLERMTPPHLRGEAWGAGSVIEDPPERFIEGVLRAKEHISAGDVYQVNLSRGWSIDLDSSITPADLYRSLRTSNPAPFAASLVMPDWAVLSSSPERLFSIRKGV